jgi:hypothetical protein
LVRCEGLQIARLLVVGRDAVHRTLEKVCCPPFSTYIIMRQQTQCFLLFSLLIKVAGFGFSPAFIDGS